MITNRITETSRFSTAIFIYIKFNSIIVEIDLVRIELGESMSEKDELLRESLQELKREVERLKEELRRLKESKAEEEEYMTYPRKRVIIGLDRFIGDVIEDIMEGIREEIERAVFIGPRGVVIARGKRRRVRESVDFNEKQAAKLLEALANENRLKILKSLSRGGKYLKELQVELSNISAGTLSSHLNILEEAGLVVQEAVRGRYLITLPGRFALKMVSSLVRYLGEFDVED
ncbi:MAG: hypothetical protein DRJ52_03820 [Thermoprotei archaeon]|nr:MAG: hypothetical protein DRJ52_03820 [Thermoprotei archaeon]